MRTFQQIDTSRVHYHTLFEENHLLSLDAAIVALYSYKLPVNKLSKYMALQTTCTHTQCVLTTTKENLYG